MHIAVFELKPAMNKPTKNVQESCSLRVEHPGLFRYCEKVSLEGELKT
jgi:hypothetical protein